MTRTLSLISGLAALSLVTTAAMLSIPGRAESFYPDVQDFLANRAVPAMSAISDSIAEQSEEIAPRNTRRGRTDRG